MSVSLLLALLAAGPTLEPIEGTTVTSADRELLPSGRHLAGIADLWLVELTDLMPSGGAVGLFDPILLSAHGRSWTQTRYFINGLEVTDPARPGNPVLQPPHGSWSGLRHESLWTAAPGLSWTLRTPAAARADARLTLGGDVGGDTWIPRGLMDREPAGGSGTTLRRRGVRDGRELELTLETARAAVSVDLVDHHRQFPTLRDEDARLLDDAARRTTVLGWARAPLLGREVDLVASWQRQSRAYDGAEFRHPAALTFESSGDALVAGARAPLFAGPRAALELGLGYTWASDRRDPHGDSPVVSDLESEWRWLHRPRLGEELSRRRLELELAGTLGEERRTRATLRAAHATSTARLTIPGGMSATSYLRSPTPAGRAVSLTVYEPTTTLAEGFDTARASVDHAARLGEWRLLFHGAVDYAAARARGAEPVAFVSPAGGIAVRRPIGDAEIYVLLRHEPEVLTAEVSEFIDPASPSGQRFEWLDDGDGVPEASETGRLLARTGGRYHEVDPDLARPSSEQLGFGWRSPRFGPFRATVTGAVRLLRNRFTVALAGPAAASYEETTVADPTGGLGDLGDALPAYARTPGSEGEEVYVLTNASQTNAWVGTELQLATAVERPWFVNLSASGYWNTGCAPFGVFPDRNDPGIIDEVTADPNARVNECGRIDADRAFGVNLLTGASLWRGLSGAIALRYRDGEPMTRTLVADLPQGSTAIMAVRRGDPSPRFTFHMTLEARLRYELDLGDWRLAAVVDAENLLGSGTEILEDMRTGSTYRDSVEMVPGRAVFVSLEGSWDRAPAPDRPTLFSRGASSP